MIYIALLVVAVLALAQVAQGSKLQWRSSRLLQAATSVVAGSALFLNVGSSFAVSGGGKDFATKDVRGESFAGQNQAGKDFTQIVGTGTKFTNANLRGARFYRADLKEADFSGTDLSAASLEDAGLVDADLSNAILEGAYLSSTITDAKSIKGADFTDALMPEITKTILCKRTDLGTANPKTGVITSESLMCN
ncbi:hypothetical protein B484DRAFT_450579 [Ochromonadaceae sp. CCMP2298]|nr:hypothetical protein B484DRAFT_450579 [Ochromonadaceae sp. CCMP2298]|mmetsp:Transcript_21721/g.48368  ORF Transcript_21721/g.48368 Transcript_21721/m.48368 type:complete len:193 (+) Transcript_21721:3-581(+)